MGRKRPRRPRDGGERVLFTDDVRGNNPCHPGEGRDPMTSMRCCETLGPGLRRGDSVSDLASERVVEISKPMQRWRCCSRQRQTQRRSRTRTIDARVPIPASCHPGEGRDPMTSVRCCAPLGPGLRRGDSVSDLVSERVVETSKLMQGSWCCSRKRQTQRRSRTRTIDARVPTPAHCHPGEGRDPMASVRCSATRDPAFAGVNRTP